MQLILFTDTWSILKHQINICCNIINLLLSGNSIDNGKLQERAENKNSASEKPDIKILDVTDFG